MPYQRLDTYNMALESKTNFKLAKAKNTKTIFEKALKAMSVSTKNVRNPCSDAHSWFSDIFEEYEQFWENVSFFIE